jgi:DNA-binding MarR family transcriptional regulator
VTHRQAPGGDRVADVQSLPCLCANLRRAARLISDLYERDAGLGALGITPFSIAQVVSRMGHCTHRTLGALLGLDQTTVSRSVAILGRRGWIHMQPGEDRRERQVRLTPKGVREFGRMEGQWRRAQEALRRRHGAKEWDTLNRSLVAIAATVPKAAGAPVSRHGGLQRTR